MMTIRMMTIRMISEMMTGDQMSEVNVSEEGISGVYAKKDIIYSSTMGLCIVSDITKLSADKNMTPVPYYVLKSYYDKSHVAYIPVEKHEVELRPIIDEEAARAECEGLKEAYKTDDGYVPDELRVGEIAYVMKLKPEELKILAGAKVPDEEE